MPLRPTGICWVTACGTALLLQVAPAIDVSAQSIRYPNDGYDWSSRPDGRYVLDCFGNCGAGCSEFPNPCGGSSQYWELEIISPVSFVRAFEENRCEHEAGGVGDVEGELHARPVQPYRARGRWTYNGLVADLCRQHDTHCRGIWDIWLLDDLVWCWAATGSIALGRAAGGCANALYNSWDYEVSTVYGYKRGAWTATGETCTVFGQSP